MKNNRLGFIVGSVISLFFIAEFHVATAVDTNPQHGLMGPQKVVALEKYWASTNIHLRKLTGWQDNQITAVAFSPRGLQLASGQEWDGKIKLLDVIGTKEIRQFSDPLHIAKAPSETVYSLAFSPDGTTLAAGYDDSTVRLWDIKSGQLKGRIQLKNPPKSLRFISNEILVAATHAAKATQVWQINARTQKIGRAAQCEISSTIADTVVSPNGTMLAIQDEHGFQTLYDINGHNKIELGLRTQTDQLFSNDSAKVASGLGNKITLWDARTGATIKEFELKTKIGELLAFSPDDKLLAFTINTNVNLLNIETGLVVATLLLVNAVKTSAASTFSPDGKIFAAGISNGNLMLWSAQG